MIAPPTELLYEQVASKIAALIAGGTLRPGDRIPSVRKTCQQQQVSVSTVLQAYVALENRGLIEARPKSGFFVRYRPHELTAEPATTTPSKTANKIIAGNAVAMVLKAVGNPRIAPLGAACPSPLLLPVEKLARTLGAVARQSGNAGLEYAIPPGCEQLRREISKRSLDWGCNLAPDEIITTIGCVEALNLCLRAVAGKDDIVAIESPTYFGVLECIRGLGIRALEIPTHPRTGMDLDALETALKRHKVAACLSVPNFNNPLGCCMPDSHKRRMVEMLAKRRIPLIEDDLYGDLHFSAERPRTAKSYDQDGGVLLCNSFSKTLAPGYRVGWVAPGRYFEEVMSLKFTNTMATATLPQLAIAEFLRNGGYDHYLRGIRNTFREQVQRFSQAIAETFPPGTKITRPSGGFVLWIELPRRCDALELHAAALAKDISLAPGPLFSAKQGYRNFIRISCGHPWSPVIERAIAILGDLAKTMAR